MPSLGADMAAGTLVRWLRAPGDAIRRGDIVASVETDKGVIDVEAFADGTIGELLVEPGREVPVGTPLATILDGQDGPAAAAPPPPASAVAAVGPAAPASPLARELLHAAGLTPAAVQGSGPHGRVVRRDVDAALTSRAAPATTAAVRSTPRARELAAGHGIDLATVAPSGPGGRVLAADVELAIAARTPAPADPGVRMRRAIAAVMSRSNREIPHYHVATTIDLEPALAWLEAANAARPLPRRILLAALMAKAVAVALRRHPDLNAVWNDGVVEQCPAVHLGVIVSLRGGGLVAPALRDCDARSVDEVMAGLRDLVGRARAGHLRSSDLADSTATMTSLGEDGVEEVRGVIFPPQVAIVGLGGVIRRPWLAGDAVVPRRVLRATLGGDHRATDGHAGSRFLADLDALLTHPEEL
jgi:pyruvate dehydrogenase E2 component (dihydrolipoamide acetyltransferase)